MDNSRPQSYGIPYDSWRPGQLEAVQKILASKKQVVMLQAPTGSGKSAIGAALGSRGRSVRLLTFTRSLQAQYGEDLPGVEVLYGLNAYKCELIPGGSFSAEYCQYSESMTKCPVSHQCGYLIQRERTKKSHRQALSYQYYLNSRWPHMTQTSLTYCDEAHTLPVVIMAQMTLEITPAVLSKAGLPPIPSFPPVDQLKKRVVRLWLEELVEEAESMCEHIDGLAYKSPADVRKRTWLRSLLLRASGIAEGMADEDDKFYVAGDQTGLKIFPLTPAPFFWRLFGGAIKLVLSSATIGNHAAFSRLMGIGRTSYDFHEVPPVYGPETQPVYYYKDAPKMSYRSGLAAHKKQVELIKRVASNFDRKEYGLVHCSSKKAAHEFANSMASVFGGNSVWVPDERHSTEQKLADWERQKRRRPGLVAFAYSFHTGIDAPDVSWQVIQKVPYMPLDEYGEQILKQNSRLYNWSAAINIEQAAGRIRRGHPNHYEKPGEPPRKMTAIIDNNFGRLRSYFSKHFINCLTTGV